MEYKYQIILLGSITGLVDDITTLFYEKVRELNLQENFYQIIRNSEVDKEYKGNQPTFVTNILRLI
jgi:hypothetical protein